MLLFAIYYTIFVFKIIQFPASNSVCKCKKYLLLIPNILLKKF